MIIAIDNGCWKIHTELERDVNPDLCDIGAVLQWLIYKDHSIHKRKVHKSRYLMNKTTIMSARFAPVLSVFFSLVHFVNSFSTQNNEVKLSNFRQFCLYTYPWTCPEQRFHLQQSVHKMDLKRIASSHQKCEFVFGMTFCKFNIISVRTASSFRH